MEIATPKTLEELLTARAESPAAVLLAGGTDLLAGWHSGASAAETVISLRGVKELDFISLKSSTDGSPVQEPSRECRRAVECTCRRRARSLTLAARFPSEPCRRAIEIGARTTHSAIAQDKTIRRRLPALAQAALSIGSPAVRNMGTIGGNIANASPAADLVPSLIVYDAIVILASLRGTRTVAIHEFYKGYKAIDLGKDEIVFSVVVPAPVGNEIARYYKVGARKAQSIAKASLAGRIETADGVVSLIRLAAGSVASIPLRLTSVEDFLSGKKLTESLIDDAAERVRSSINPIDDVRSTAAYRRLVMGTLLKRFVADAGAVRTAAK